jgi:tRNA (guanine26-N2/guanine27-N2)-dimethyltransferase
MMKYLNIKKNYADKEKIGKFLSLMDNEVGMPPYYYNLHEVCKLQNIQPVPKFDDVLERLTGRGFKAARTHFSPISIKTDASLHDIMEASGWKN